MGWKTAIGFGLMAGIVFTIGGLKNVTIGELFDYWLRAYGILGSFLWLMIDEGWDRATNPDRGRGAGGSVVTAILLMTASVTIAAVYAAMNQPEGTTIVDIMSVAPMVAVVVLSALFLAAEDTAESLWPVLFLGVSLILYFDANGWQLPADPYGLIFPRWVCCGENTLLPKAVAAIRVIWEAIIGIFGYNPSILIG